MGSQFIHADSFGREAGKGKRSGNTIDSIVGEAEREEGQCYHIEEPKPPVILYGLSFREAGEEAKKWAETVKDARGHKLRKDALCMVAGVVSVPEDIKNWDRYKKDTVKWLKKKYGDCLKSVVEHTDERHQHLHFAVVAKPGERFETIHQGYAAYRGADLKRGDRKRSADEKSNGRRQAIRAYQTAMRDYQDEFYEGVSKRHGLTRIGPGRRRLSRSEWKQEQAQAVRIAENLQKIDTQKADMREYAIGLKAREDTVAEKEKLGIMAAGGALQKIFYQLSEAQIQECWAVAKIKADELRATPTQSRNNTTEQKRGRSH